MGDLQIVDETSHIFKMIFIKAKADEYEGGISKQPEITERFSTTNENQVVKSKSIFAFSMVFWYD